MGLSSFQRTAEFPILWIINESILIFGLKLTAELDLPRTKDKESFPILALFKSWRDREARMIILTVPPLRDAVPAQGKGLNQAWRQELCSTENEHGLEIK